MSDTSVPNRIPVYPTTACEACCERIGHTRPVCEDLCPAAKAEIAEDSGE